MSNEAKQHPEVWDWRTFILKHGPNSSTYRHVLLTLSCYMDSAGDSCFPSYDTLEEATCLSRPSLSKYLNKADKDGWIERTKHGYGGKSWARNEYRARVPDEVLKAVKQVNHEGSKGSKPEKGRQLNSQGEAVKQVNSTSSCTSPSNSSSGSAHTREDPVELIRALWGIEPTENQAKHLREDVNDCAQWEQVLKRFAMEDKTHRGAIGWAYEDYQDGDGKAEAKEGAKAYRKWNPD